MVVGVCSLQLHIHGNDSLKGKRKVVKSVIERVRSRYNVSIAEVGSNDSHRDIEIGITVVSNNGRRIDSTLRKIVEYIDGMNVAELVDYSLEVIHQ